MALRPYKEDLVGALLEEVKSDILAEVRRYPMTLRDILRHCRSVLPQRWNDFRESVGRQDVGLRELLLAVLHDAPIYTAMAFVAVCEAVARQGLDDVFLGLEHELAGFAVEPGDEALLSCARVQSMIALAGAIRSVYLHDEAPARRDMLLLARNTEEYGILWLYYSPETANQPGNRAHPYGITSCPSFVRLAELLDMGILEDDGWLLHSWPSSASTLYSYRLNWGGLLHSEPVRLFRWILADLLRREQFLTSGALAWFDERPINPGSWSVSGAAPTEERLRRATLFSTMKPSRRAAYCERCGDSDISCLLQDTAAEVWHEALVQTARPSRALLPRLVQAVGLRCALPASFEAPWIARIVESTFTREERLAEVQWVREEYSDDLARRVASEAAVAFSLENFSLLHDLAEQYVASDCPGQSFDDHYCTYRLPKGNNRWRTITAPRQPLRGLQRRLLRHGFDLLEYTEECHGFRRGRSIRTNAERHIGHEYVVKIDVSEFFPTTSYEQVVEACRRLAMGALSDECVHFVASLCCYRGFLPTGAPTSPSIGNLVLAEMDEVLGHVAAYRGICYTRYADDLVFSGPLEAREMIDLARRFLGDRGFSLHPEKTSVMPRWKRQKVTGIVVNEKLSLPRRWRKKLRAAVHTYCAGRRPHWEGREISRQKLMGLISFLGVVDPEQAEQYRVALRGRSAPYSETG